MPVHLVKQGDSMTSIADQYGFFWESIWNHDRNAELRRQRSNPNILLAGDRVFIPEKQPREENGDTGKVHTFRMKSIPARLTLRLCDEDGEPRAGVRYTLEVDGQKFTGETSADGIISHFIPPRAKKAHLRLEDEDEEWDLDIGHVNPVNYVSGVQCRLKNLGFYQGDISGRLDDETRNAIRDFQAAHGLEITGEPDAATRDALVAEHQS
jgi:N-acetylmuramoyl-L-alanine amidase